MKRTNYQGSCVLMIVLVTSILMLGLVGLYKRVALNKASFVQAAAHERLLWQTQGVLTWGYTLARERFEQFVDRFAQDETPLRATVSYGSAPEEHYELTIAKHDEQILSINVRAKNGQQLSCLVQRQEVQQHESQPQGVVGHSVQEESASQNTHSNSMQLSQKPDRVFIYSIEQWTSLHA